MEYMKERPPFAYFESRATERRRTAEEGGGVYYVTEDFAHITPAGSKDKIEKEVKSWFTHMAQLEKIARWNPDWTRHYKEAYQTWKETNVVPINGTPVANWPVVTSAEVKILRSINIHTVEDLAVCNEEAINRIGLGGRGLRDRAKDWLAMQTESAPLVNQLAAFRSTNEELQRTVESQRQTIQLLQQQLNLKHAEVERVPVASVQQPHSDTGSALGRMKQNAEDADDAILERVTL